MKLPRFIRISTSFQSIQNLLETLKSNKKTVDAP